jgi:hypothetical protein
MCLLRSVINTGLVAAFENRLTLMNRERHLARRSYDPSWILSGLSGHRLLDSDRDDIPCHGLKCSYVELLFDLACSRAFPPLSTLPIRSSLHIGKIQALDPL